MNDSLAHFKFQSVKHMSYSLRVVCNKEWKCL